MADGQEPETISVDQVDAPNLHDVNPSAVAAAQAKGAAAPAEVSAEYTAPSADTASGVPPHLVGRIDRNGRTYDPVLHESDLRSDGRLKIRKGARGQSSKASVLPPLDAPAADAQPGEATATVEPPVDYEQVARGIVDPLLGVVTIVMGPDEWEFSKVEREQYVRIVEQLAIKYNIASGMPPELQLAELMVVSVAQRASKPRTGALLSRAKAWVVQLVTGRRARQQPPPPPVPADPPHADAQDSATFPGPGADSVQ